MSPKKSLIRSWLWRRISASRVSLKTTQNLVIKQRWKSLPPPTGVGNHLSGIREVHLLNARAKYLQLPPPLLYRQTTDHHNVPLKTMISRKWFLSSRSLVKRPLSRRRPLQPPPVRTTIKNRR